MKNIDAVTGAVDTVVDAAEPTTERSAKYQILLTALLSLNSVNH